MGFAVRSLIGISIQSPVHFTVPWLKCIAVQSLCAFAAAAQESLPCAAVFLDNFVTIIRIGSEALCLFR